MPTRTSTATSAGTTANGTVDNPLVLHPFKVKRVVVIPPVQSLPETEPDLDDEL